MAPEVIARRFESEFEQLISAEPEAAYIRDLLDILPEEYSSDYDKWLSVLLATLTKACEVRDQHIVCWLFILAKNVAPNGMRRRSIIRGLIYSRAAGRKGRRILLLGLSKFWARSANQEAFELARSEEFATISYYTYL